MNAKMWSLKMSPCNIGHYFKSCHLIYLKKLTFKIQDKGRGKPTFLRSGGLATKKISSTNFSIEKDSCSFFKVCILNGLIPSILL